MSPESASCKTHPPVGEPSDEPAAEHGEGDPPDGGGAHKSEEILQPGLEDSSRAGVASFGGSRGQRINLKP